MKMILLSLLILLAFALGSVTRHANGDHVPLGSAGSGPANVLCGSLASAEKALVEPEDIPAPDDCLAFSGAVRVWPQQYMKTVTSYDGRDYEIYSVLTPDGRSWFTFTRAPGSDT